MRTGNGSVVANMPVTGPASDVAELAGEVVGGERDPVAGLAEVDDPVVRDAGVGVLDVLDHRVEYAAIPAR